MVVDGPDFDGVHAVDGIHHLLANFNYFPGGAEADHSAVCVTVVNTGVSFNSSVKD